MATNRKTLQKIRISVQYRNLEFDEKRTSYSPEEFEREVCGQMGIVRWSGKSREPIPQGLFAEFVRFWESRKYDFTINLSRGYYDIEEQRWIKID